MNKTKSTIKKDALLEVRIENIPARFITSAKSQMEKIAVENLKKLGIKYESIETFGTYKRLVLYINDMEAKTEEKTVTATGPSAKLLKDDKGNYTPQSFGFAKSQKTTPDKLKVVKTPKGDFLVIERKTGGEASYKKLVELFPLIISKLQFPKNMVWEKERFRFARPIRSIIALYGEKIISFNLADIKSRRKTVGLSAKGSKEITIKSAEKYFKVLENLNVLVKDEKRLSILNKEISSSAKRMKLSVNIDAELLEENLYLVEYPVAVVGDFSKDFLDLPPELVHLVMKSQLKFFTVANSKGVLEPYFIGIRDGISKGQKNVRDGFKNVLEARFKDALFFYKKDLAMPLDAMNDKLKDITFHQGLGTMYDKCHRIKEFSTILSKELTLKKLNKEEVFMASEYIYCDLASEVVKEFTELQGIMAYYYAKNAGFSKGVCKTVKEFYWPLSATSALPASDEGALVSLSGKIDTILSSFAVGITVTGSADPYALRRHAMGLARIIIAKKFSLNLNNFLKAAFEFLPETVKEKNDKEKISRDILEFIWQRAEAVFTESGYKFDEIRSIKSYFIKSGDLRDAEQRIKSLHLMRKNPDFDSLAASFKRAKNILKQMIIKETDVPDETLFEESAEKELYKNIKNLSLKGADILKDNDYSSYLSELVKIKPSLDGFFDNVMVMVKDERVKENRLKLIKSLVVLFTKVADLSQIQG